MTITSSFASAVVHNIKECVVTVYTCLKIYLYKRHCLFLSTMLYHWAEGMCGYCIYMFEDLPDSVLKTLFIFVNKALSWGC